MLAQIIVIAILHFIQIPIATTAFSLYSPSVHRYTHHPVNSQKNKVLLFGSIYAPSGKDGDDTEEGGDRDHLGMKRSSNGVQPIASWASTNDSTSTATTNPDDIQQAVEEAVSQASKLEENKDASTPAKKTTKLTQRINVRFINFDTMGGLEKVSVVVPGTNILKVADVRRFFANSRPRIYIYFTIDAFYYFKMFIHNRRQEYVYLDNVGRVYVVHVRLM